MKYLNAFNKITGIGPKKLEKIESFFNNWEEAWRGTTSDFEKCGLDQNTIKKIIEIREKINPEEEWEIIQKYNLRLIVRENHLFPKILLETSNPPFFLYQRGDLDLNQEKCIAIVGSRKNTPYGQQVVERIVPQLVEAGFTIISGLALGIDALAHQSALNSNGKTAAVLGSGLADDFIYPRFNFNLAQKIIDSGCLLSEFYPTSQANTFTFPIRNRLIAGLSLGTIIIEAAEKSGSLITAQFSLDYNREVFAVPGNIFSSQSTGTNKLIQKGGKLVTDIKDIIEELNLENTRKISQESQKESLKNPENETEKLILSVLSNEPLHVDKIAQLTKLKTMTVLSALSLMEIRGWTKNIGGQNYIIV